MSALILVLSKTLVSFIVPLSNLINKSIEQSWSKTVLFPVSELNAYYPLSNILIGLGGYGRSNPISSPEPFL